MQAAFIQGMGIGGSLIIAVGAQNAFVLKQGIKRSYTLPIALLCSIIDALMITAGVAGLGHIIESFPTIKHVASFGGTAFLLWYGANALKASFVAKGIEMDQAAETASLECGMASLRHTSSPSGCRTMCTPSSHVAVTP